MKHPRDGDPRFEAWRLLLEAHSALVDVLERELQAGGGPPLTWYDVLVQLSKTPDGRMRMHDLAESVLLSKSGITRLVDRMERAGLIARTSCPSDRRVVYAALTSEGRETFSRAAPLHLAGIEEHFTRHISESEARSLKSALQKVLAQTRQTGDCAEAG